ncbi:hypothetical protein P691DRAFT_782353 [Macrolepiota fuliginosa MF-IS2]|uniref:Uncharacterized protein n=1 Tax=Macrolepiota fuliginosa MF-IS2 TaxID=1400762 RepID=A0A9P5XCC5_9AGAR|nr:hypothetical protein P691DRAFT_782353 [Macrolepiota fuliginosa MF-IS2]
MEVGLCLIQKINYRIDYVALTVMVNVLTVKHVDLKKEAPNAPEVNQILPGIPLLGGLVGVLCDCPHDRLLSPLNAPPSLQYIAKELYRRDYATAIEDCAK